MRKITPKTDMSKSSKMAQPIQIFLDIYVVYTPIGRAVEKSRLL
jgi:hypothetical protein